MIWLNLGQYPRPQTGNTSLLFCTNTNTLSESIIRDYDLGSKNAYVIWRIIQEARLTEWPPESTEKGKSAHWRRKWQPTPVFLPGESQDGGAWWAAVYRVAQSRTRLKRLNSSSSSKSPQHLLCSRLAGYLSPSACSRPPSCLRSCSLLAPPQGRYCSGCARLALLPLFPFPPAFFEPAPQLVQFQRQFFPYPLLLSNHTTSRKQNTLLVMFFSYNLWIRELISQVGFLG